MPEPLFIITLSRFENMTGRPPCALHADGAVEPALKKAGKVLQNTLRSPGRRGLVPP